jgi:hypothetical protein
MRSEHPIYGNVCVVSWLRFSLVRTGGDCWGHPTDTPACADALADPEKETLGIASQDLRTAVLPLRDLVYFFSFPKMFLLNGLPLLFVTWVLRFKAECGFCWCWCTTALHYQGEGHAHAGSIPAEVLGACREQFQSRAWLTSNLCVGEVRRMRKRLPPSPSFAFSDNGCCVLQQAAHVLRYTPPIALWFGTLHPDYRVVVWDATPRLSRCGLGRSDFVAPVKTYPNSLFLASLQQRVHFLSIVFFANYS